jgi:hypothetical protein
MKRGGTRVGVGTRFAYDGEIVEIVEMHAVDGIPEAPAKDLCTQCRPRGRSRHRCHPSDDTRATPSWNTAQSSGAATRGTPPVDSAKRLSILSTVPVPERRPMATRLEIHLEFRMPQAPLPAGRRVSGAGAAA